MHKFRRINLTKRRTLRWRSSLNWNDSNIILCRHLRQDLSTSSEYSIFVIVWWHLAGLSNECFCFLYKSTSIFPTESSWLNHSVMSILCWFWCKFNAHTNAKGSKSNKFSKKNKCSAHWETEEKKCGIQFLSCTETEMRRRKSDLKRKKNASNTYIGNRCSRREAANAKKS